MAQMQVSDLSPLPAGIESAIQQYFASAGLAILDVAFEGDPMALSRFQGGTDAIGLKSGLVLTSGHAQSTIANRHGPASIGLNQASTNNASTATSARLNALAYPRVVNDVAKIVITFIPYGDTIRFRYVFASEEYPEYGCSNFNDLFGFFLYRTGFPETANIALIPGTKLPVTIENLHPTDLTPETPNCMPLFEQYFRNNDQTSNQPVYDGFTTVFVAKAAVVPCVKYTMELSICDVEDSIYDSAVFLEEGSFSSNALHLWQKTAGEGGNIGGGCPGGTTEASRNIQVQTGSLDIAKKQLPNAFTPNDDGLNDWFDPLYVLALNGINIPPDRARLHLINRWGEVVFDAQPYEPWSGLRGAKGQLLPHGVYYYRLELDLDKKVVLTGAVTLFR